MRWGGGADADAVAGVQEGKDPGDLLALPPHHHRLNSLITLHHHRLNSLITSPSSEQPHNLYPQQESKDPGDLLALQRGAGSAAHSP